MKRIITAAILLSFIACDAVGEPAAPKTAALSGISVAPTYHPERSQYPFADTDAPLVRLQEALEPPAGYKRVAAASGSFAEWLRGLPLLRDRRGVRAYDGRSLASPSAGIVSMDVGTRDLQQCADSAIRLHAEYLWARNRADELAYHFTSGDEVRFEDWVDGERIRAVGSEVTRTQGARRARDHASMREWLDLVYRYAGTRSLHRDSESVDSADVRGGDFLVAPGSPGHAVVILDVALSPDGKRLALIGQGFMPAQEFHVLTAESAIDGVWFEIPERGQVRTPSWVPFSTDELRRFSAQ